MFKIRCKGRTRIATAAFAVAVPLAATPAGGAGIFNSKCTACHGPDASGSTPTGRGMNIRDLRSPAVQKQSNAEIAAIITKGKAPMPGFGKSLAPAEIQQVIVYLRSIAAKS